MDTILKAMFGEKYGDVLFGVLVSGAVNLFTEIPAEQIEDKYKAWITSRKRERNHDVQSAARIAFECAVRKIYKEWDNNNKSWTDTLLIETVGRKRAKECYKNLTDSDVMTAILFDNPPNEEFSRYKVYEMLLPSPDQLEKRNATTMLAATQNLRDQLNKEIARYIKDAPKSFQDSLNSQLFDSFIFFLREMFKENPRVFRSIMVDTMNLTSATLEGVDERMKTVEKHITDLKDLMTCVFPEEQKKEIYEIFKKRIDETCELWLTTNAENFDLLRHEIIAQHKELQEENALIRSALENRLVCIQDQIRLGSENTEKTIEHSKDEIISELRAIDEKFTPQPVPEKKVFPTCATIQDPGKFVNREREQDNLRDFLKSDDHRVFFLTGLGGMGKSVLMAKIMHEQPNAMVFWTECQKDETHTENLLSKLNEFLLWHDNFALQNALNNPKSNLTSRIEALTSGLDRGYILVFDNFQTLLNKKRKLGNRELKDFFSGLLKGGHKAKIIITGHFRPRIPGIPAGLSSHDSLHKLKYEDALNLLQALTQENVADLQLEKLAKRVYGHPLGLVVMAQLLTRGYSIDEIVEMSLTEMDEECDESEGFVIRLLTDLWRRLTSVERDILNALAIYRPFVPGTAVGHVVGDKMKTRDLIHLAECSLIERTQSDQNAWHYSLHGLVREFVLGELDPEQKQAAHKQAAAYWSSLEWVREPRGSHELANIMECRYHCYQAREYELATGLAWFIARYLGRFALYAECLSLMEQTLETATDDRDRGICYNNIGLIHSSKGEWDLALEYYRKSEEIGIEVGDKPTLGTTYNNIGVIYQHKGEWDLALEYYRKSEKIFIEVGDKAGLGTTYNNIGLIHRKKGELDLALEYYRKSEEIGIEVGNKAGLGMTYINIGVIYQHKGEWDLALEYYRKSEKIRIEVGDKAGLGTTYNNIGLIHSNKGELDLALEYYRKSEEIGIEVGNKAGLGMTYINIGGIHDSKGEWDLALEYFRNSEKILIEVSDKAGLGGTYNNIGLIHNNKGEWDLALEYYRKSEEIRIEVGDKAGLGGTYNNIGLIHRKKDDLDLALEYYRKSEKIRIEVGDKAGLGTTYNNIGLIHRKKGDLDLALEYYRKSEKILIEVGDKAGLGTTYNNIGLIHNNKGELDLALEYFRKSEKIKIEVGDKPGLISTHCNIAAVYYHQSDVRAVDRIGRAVALAIQLGARHELSQVTPWLEDIYKKFGVQDGLDDKKR